MLSRRLLLLAAASTASAQTHWNYYGYGSKARGYYGTPYESVRNMGSGGGDQFGYGPGHSYARQAPSQYHWRY
jgi:hypothetical protein